MNETLALIQQAADERQTLYHLAAKRQLTPQGKARLSELTSEIAALWDRHRRELAAQNFKPYSYSGEKQAS